MWLYCVSDPCKWNIPVVWSHSHDLDGLPNSDETDVLIKFNDPHSIFVSCIMEIFMHNLMLLYLKHLNWNIAYAVLTRETAPCSKAKYQRNVKKIQRWSHAHCVNSKESVWFTVWKMYPSPQCPANMPNLILEKNCARLVMNLAYSLKIS